MMYVCVYMHVCVCECVVVVVVVVCICLCVSSCVCVLVVVVVVCLCLCGVWCVCEVHVEVRERDSPHSPWGSRSSDYMASSSVLTTEGRNSGQLIEQNASNNKNLVLQNELLTASDHGIAPTVDRKYEADIAAVKAPFYPQSSVSPSGEHQWPRQKQTLESSGQ